MQDNESTCIHCGQRIILYRGLWFGPGDEVQCTTEAYPAERRHEASRADMDAQGQGRRVAPAGGQAMSDER